MAPRKWQDSGHRRSQYVVEKMSTLCILRDPLQRPLWLLYLLQPCCPAHPQTEGLFHVHEDGMAIAGRRQVHHLHLPGSPPRCRHDIQDRWVMVHHANNNTRTGDCRVNHLIRNRWKIRAEDALITGRSKANRNLIRTLARAVSCLVVGGSPVLLSLALSCLLLELDHLAGGRNRAIFCPGHACCCYTFHPPTTLPSRPLSCGIAVAHRVVLISISSPSLPS